MAWPRPVEPGACNVTATTAAATPNANTATITQIAASPARSARPAAVGSDARRTLPHQADTTTTAQV